MIANYLSSIPVPLIQFVLVTVFSLLIGLSQRKIHIIDHNDQKLFGTDRTFTFIGILGYLLFILQPDTALLFIVGAVILAGFLLVYYSFHLKTDRDYGITSMVVALITYCLGPLIVLQPLWFVLIVLVTILIFAELKESFISLTQKIGKDEFITLAKFIIIAGVILPIVPDTPFIQGFNLTPYKIWVVVVVVSGVSYVSYLLKKFLLTRSSIVISGLIGGLYSSTATTIIMAKKSKHQPDQIHQYMAAILFATAMMYLRVAILILIFNFTLFLKAWHWLVVMVFVSMLTGLFILFFRNRKIGTVDQDLNTEINPLEFKTALIFTALFVLLSFITYFALQKFGAIGLNVLSWIVGLVDIDPFLISLFEGKFDISYQVILVAMFQAIISNNFVKMIYAISFGNKRSWVYLLPGFLSVILINLILIFLI